MLDLGRGIANLDIGHGVRAAVLAEQQRIALGEIAHALGIGSNANQPAIGVLALASRDALGNNGRAAALAVVDHLGAGVGLLVIVGDRDRIEFADRILAIEDAAGIFPGDRAAGLDLGPADLAALALAQRALGDEVVDPALALGVARVPVLHCRILDLGIVERDQFDHRGVKLVLVALRRGAAFEVGNVGALVGHDQGAFELPGVFGIDPEIGRQLHRAAHALWNVDEGPVGKDRAVQGGKEVVMHRHDLAEPALHQVRVFADRFRNRKEDHPGLFQFLAEGGGDRNRIEHRIDRHLARAFHPGEHLLLFERNAQLFIDLEDLGIDLIEA